MPEGQDILVIVQPSCGTELTSFRMLGDVRLASTKVSRTSTRPRRPQQGGMLKHAKTIKAPSMFMASRTPGLMFNYRASFSHIFQQIHVRFWIWLRSRQWISKGREEGDWRVLAWSRYASNCVDCDTSHADRVLLEFLLHFLDISWS